MAGERKLTVMGTLPTLRGAIIAGRMAALREDHSRGTTAYLLSILRREEGGR